MSKENESESALERHNINRRDIVKAAGATMVGLGGLAGTASAHQWNFYGCSQVCVDVNYDYAVIDTGSGWRCEQIDDPSNRNDPPVRGWNNVYCLEVSGGEAIVGLCEDSTSGTFRENPNRCAENYDKPNSCSEACE